MGKSCHWSLKQWRMKPEIPNLNLICWQAFSSPLHFLLDHTTMYNPAPCETGSPVSILFLRFLGEAPQVLDVSLLIVGLLVLKGIDHFYQDCLSYELPRLKIRVSFTHQTFQSGNYDLAVLLQPDEFAALISLPSFLFFPLPVFVSTCILLPASSVDRV